MSSDSDSPNRILISLGIVVVTSVCTCVVVSLAWFLFYDLVAVSPMIPRTARHTFEIESNQGWQESAIRVSQGDAVHIIYQSGQWRVADWAEYVDAQGYPRFEGYVPHIAHGALIAQIADGPIIPIFNEAWFAADRDGTISFRINDADEFLYDNTGAIEVTIEVTRQIKK